MATRFKLLTMVLCISLLACATRPQLQWVHDACQTAIQHTPAITDMADICRSAETGQKRALLELGKRFEDGRAGIVDYEIAKVAYEAAASPESAPLQIYELPLPGDNAGRVVSIPGGRQTPGEPEALYRLGLMYREGRGVEKDINREDIFLQAANDSGYRAEK